MSKEMIILVGNLTRNPEMKYMPDGRAVCSGGIACDRSYTNSTTGVRVKRTDFWRYSIFGKKAEVFNQYMQSGRPVMLEGKMNSKFTPSAKNPTDLEANGPETWTDQSGVARASYELLVDNFTFISGTGSAGGQQQGGAQGTAPAQATNAPDPGIPF